MKLSESDIHVNFPSRNGPPTTTNNVVKGKYISKQHRQWNSKTKISRSIDMRFYWVRDRIRQNHFHIFYEEGRKKLADYVTKHHPIWQHITMRPRYLKETKKYTEDLKY